MPLEYTWPLNGYAKNALGHKNLPPWYPEDASFAEYVLSSRNHKYDRQCKTANAKDFPIRVELTSSFSNRYLYPVPWTFVNGKVHNQAKTFRGWLGIRSPYLRRLDCISIRLIPALRAQEWKNKLGGWFNADEQDLFFRAFHASPSQLKELDARRSRRQATVYEMPTRQYDDALASRKRVEAFLDAVLAANPFIEEAFEQPAGQQPQPARQSPYIRTQRQGEHPPRTEADRARVFPRGFQWGQLVHHFFEGVAEDGRKVLRAYTGLHPSELVKDTWYDIWLDAENNYAVYFLAWLDPAQMFFSQGERLVDLESLSWIVQTPTSASPFSGRKSTRLWQAHVDIPSRIDDARFIPVLAMSSSSSSTSVVENKPALSLPDCTQPLPAPSFDGIAVELDVAGLPDPVWRAFIIFDLHERGFFYDLQALDALIMREYVDLPGRRSRLQSYLQSANLWEGVNGLDGALYGPFGGPFTSGDLVVRREALQKLLHIVCVWPRSGDVEDMVNELQLHSSVTWKSMDWDLLAHVERVVWAFYTQTQFDFNLRDPILPVCRPQLPPAVLSHASKVSCRLLDFRSRRNAPPKPRCDEPDVFRP